MALSSDQKKHLLIGSGIGAIATIFGSLLFGGRSAQAMPMLSAPHGQRRHHEDGDDDNGRGEYKHRKKKHKHRGHHD